MKFVGGSHHSQDAPMRVQRFVLAGERSIDIEQHEASPDWQPAWAATEAVVQRPASSGEVHRRHPPTGKTCRRRWRPRR
jgi:hypothetical protein